MQSEVVYGARFSAAFRAVYPLVFAVVLVVANDGNLRGTTVLLFLGAIGFGLWQARGVLKPKQLMLDRYALVYQPAFSANTTAIKWAQVKSFEIKGKDKQRKLVCNYVNSDDGGARTLNLGDGWSAGGTDYFADKLEKVRDHLEYVRRRYQVAAPSGGVTAQRPLTTSTVTTVPKLKPQQAGASVRSGQVYAKPNAAIKAPTVTLSHDPNTGVSKPVGWGLLVAGIGGGAASAILFEGACRNGLCGQGFWDVPDPRLWLFLLVWSACLWAIWAGAKALQT